MLLHGDTTASVLKFMHADNMQAGTVLRSKLGCLGARHPSLSPAQHSGGILFGMHEQVVSGVLYIRGVTSQRHRESLSPIGDPSGFPECISFGTLFFQEMIIFFKGK
jgi:hypothetical protein